MVKKDNVKLTELQEKAKYTEEETKNIKTAQRTAFVYGLIILGALLIFVFFLSLYLRIWWQPFLPVLIFLVMYFVWAPQDVGWGSFAKEGYVKAVLLGGKRKRFFGSPNGEDYDENWNLIDAKNFKGKRYSLWGIKLTVQPYFDLVIWGMHFIYEWPFGTIYTELNEWERYYPNLRRALPRREILRQFSVLPYPQYIKASNAEDANRLGINFETNVVMRWVNPDKALFKETTSWLDIVRPLIEGGYVFYIKSHTLQEILEKKMEIGQDLMKDMLSSDPEYPGTLVEMIEDKYGVKILSISIIDISGADGEEQKAIRAKAVAILNKEATIINAEADSQKSAIKTMGSIVSMISRATGKTEKEVTDTLGQDVEKRYADSLDLAQRAMASEKNQLIDIRTGSGGGKGSGDSLLALIAANSMMLNRSGSGNSLSSGKKASADSEKKNNSRLLKEAGFDLPDDEDDD
ncbi:MAG: SPFH domain-containing protein [Candidatus Paceibacterota bacterium]|jgi:regulator of protease activity HflC (stomatin/prohibitin superfamily)